MLGLNGDAFQIPLAPAPQRLPEILSREELARLFAMAAHLESRTFLMLAYGTGLRLSELCRLRAEHIDSDADRMCIRVEQGKGGKDRYVPLSEDVLQLLRTWWRSAHPRPWLFGGLRDPSRPIDTGSAQRWYYLARVAAGITKRGGIHSLRHYLPFLTMSREGRARTGMARFRWLRRATARALARHSPGTYRLLRNSMS